MLWASFCFSLYQPQGHVLLKNRLRIINKHNDHSACCAHQSKTGTKSNHGIDNAVHKQTSPKLLHSCWLTDKGKGLKECMKTLHWPSFIRLTFPSLDLELSFCKLNKTVDEQTSWYDRSVRVLWPFSGNVEAVLWCVVTWVYSQMYWNVSWPCDVCVSFTCFVLHYLCMCHNLYALAVETVMIIMLLNPSEYYF